MKHLGKRLMTLALALLMALSVLPAEWNGSAQAAGAYGKVTADGVKVRKKASTSAAYWFKLDTGYVCEVLDVVAGDDITWYKVNVEHPDPGSERTYIGYVHGDFFALLTEAEADQYEQSGKVEDSTVTVPPAAGDTSADDSTAGDASTGDEENDAAQEEEPVQPETPSTDGNTTAYAGATGQISNDGVNFRVSEGGELIRKLDRGTVVEILTIPAVVDTNHWYKIRYAGDEGYVMSTFLKVISTGDPNGTPTDPDADISIHGYVKLVLSSANLRLSPGGAVGAQWQNKGEVLKVVDTPVTHANFLYYPVVYEGNFYYVREDTVQLQATPGSSAGSTATQKPVTIVGYVRTTEHGVNLRLKPAGKVILQVDKNTVLPLLANPAKEGQYYWYYVETASGARGYLRSDCIAVCNADGSDIGESTPPVTTEPPAQVSYGYVITIKDKVNLRTKPTGSSQEQIAEGVVLPLTGEPDTKSSSKYTWYPVKAASGKTGVLRGDCVKLCNADGSDIGSTPTDAPTEEPVVTAPPTATPEPVSQYGYVMITEPGTNLRKKPGGAVVDSLSRNSVWPMTGDVVTKNKVDWYPVEADGVQGYVREDCCFKLSKTQQESYLAGNGVPEEKPEEVVNYVITTLDSVNLRAAATKDSSARFNVPLGTVMAFKQAPVTNSNWYKVVYSNTEVWVLGTCVRQMTAAEYEEWAAAHPDSTPQPDVIEGYVKTTSSGVNLRKTAGGKVITRLEKGSVYPYSKTEVAGKKTWYYVKTESGLGYLHGDYVIECNADGSNIGTGGTDAPSTGQEASYTTLKLGSQGTAVKNLVQELKNQGFYTGEVTNKYTSAVETAVRNFQSAKGLKVDGIAGASTQHKLFGTVPIGSGDSANLSFTHYPAEKIDWFTGGIQQLWPKGANYKIYDVKTGVVWWAHRWSGGFHADIEPLTAADTAKLCKIYGVDDAQDIYDKNLWQRRPCLVTIGTRTFACSLDGMPHNPDGDTIPDNNMTGQVCLHFTNSKGHDSGAVSSSHQEAIEYAYKNAPGGQKK